MAKGACWNYFGPKPEHTLTSSRYLGSSTEAGKQWIHTASDHGSRQPYEPLLLPYMPEIPKTRYSNLSHVGCVVAVKLLQENAWLLHQPESRLRCWVAVGICALSQLGLARFAFKVSCDIS